MIYLEVVGSLYVKNQQSHQTLQHDPLNTTKEYKLHNIDGMYSYITDTEDRVYHFAAWTEVTKI